MNKYKKLIEIEIKLLKILFDLYFLFIFFIIYVKKRNSSYNKDLIFFPKDSYNTYNINHKKKNLNLWDRKKNKVVTTTAKDIKYILFYFISKIYFKKVNE